MNSKRKDLQYASVFLLAVALTFLMGKGDNLWLISWGDLIPSLFVLFIAGDCLHSSLLRIKRGEEPPASSPLINYWDNRGGVALLFR